MKENVKKILLRIVAGALILVLALGLGTSFRDSSLKATETDEVAVNSGVDPTVEEVVQEIVIEGTEGTEPQTLPAEAETLPAETETSPAETEVTEPSTESTEPSEESTDPSEDSTEPSEPVYYTAHFYLTGDVIVYCGEEDYDEDFEVERAADTTLVFSVSTNGHVYIDALPQYMQPDGTYKILMDSDKHIAVMYEEPEETEPAETEPAETEPTETEPTETEPTETEPTETEPTETEPAETEPTETEPAETEPTEPVPSTYGQPAQLRQQPTGTSSVICTVPENTEITVISFDNSDWALVSYDGITGYMHRYQLVNVQFPAKNPDKITVNIFSSRRDVLEAGEIITLSSVVEGAEDYVVFYQWECNRGSGFQRVPGANEPTYQFAADVETLSWDWRLTINCFEK